jgi:hypothetical protein
VTRKASASDCTSYPLLNDGMQAERMSDTPIKAGVIEGFFGKPWDWPGRLSSAGFLRDCGYQFYIYAPKADPFLRRRWREPLPAETLQHLRELSESCRALHRLSHVLFVRCATHA